MIPGLNLIFQNAGCAGLYLSRSHMYKYSSNMVGSEYRLYQFVSAQHFYVLIHIIYGLKHF